MKVKELFKRSLKKERLIYIHITTKKQPFCVC